MIDFNASNTSPGDNNLQLQLKINKIADIYEISLPQAQESEPVQFKWVSDGPDSLKWCRRMLEGHLKPRDHAMRVKRGKQYENTYMYGM